MSSAPYRVSKSAVNELAVVQSKEWNAATVKAQASGDAKAIAAAAPLISVVAVHPGWVRLAPPSLSPLTLLFSHGADMSVSCVGVMWAGGHGHGQCRS
jgi:hypothetical protein